MPAGAVMFGGVKTKGDVAEDDPTATFTTVCAAAAPARARTDREAASIMGVEKSFVKEEKMLVLRRSRSTGGFRWVRGGPL